MKKNKIALLTGLVFCGKHCGCGERSRLWFSVLRSTPPEWLVANGWTTEDVIQEIKKRHSAATK